MSKRLSTKEQLEKEYGCENYYDVLFDSWANGHKKQFVEQWKHLKVADRKEFLVFLLWEKPYEWEKLLFLLISEL